MEFMAVRAILFCHDYYLLQMKRSNSV